ncbi:MAG: hypothetical protein JWO95_1965 [Verrucomicrobiales bacterium]|nr:hypothetical protein [Verrucomicrobiales bacterium]
MSVPILTSDRRIRIFLSSRIEEFASARRKLVWTIRSEMGLTPVYFEAEARPYAPRDLYSAYIADSEIFVGIYGSGYGWIDKEHGMTVSGLHDEWRLASKLPRLAFVKRTVKNRDKKLDDLLGEIQKSDVSVVKFRTDKELVEKVRSAIAATVSERFLDPETPTTNYIPDYATQLIKEYDRRIIIDTEFFNTRVEPVLRSAPRILITGAPGTGKTVILFKIAKTGGTIYLSLRNRSLLSAATYLSNKLSQLVGRKPRSFASADDALFTFESLRDRNDISILIDDSEQAPGVAMELAKMPTGQGRLIFASRSRLPLPNNFTVLTCDGFTATEAVRFIERSNPSLSPSAPDAIEKSKGNPLYLSYFAQSNSAHVESSIDGYHEVMWAKLSSDQKELLGVIAVCEIAPTVETIANALSDYRVARLTGVGARGECDKIIDLLSIHEHRIRLFHTAFRDFVINQLATQGTGKALHKSVGNAMGREGQNDLRVYHFICAGIGDTVYDQLLSCATWAQITGRLSVARKALATAVWIGRQKRDYRTIGSALHFLAEIKQHSSHPAAALRTAMLSEAMFKRTNNKHLVQIAKITRGTFLAELSAGKTAISLLEDGARYFHKVGLQQIEAMARANLGFVLLRAGLMSRSKIESLAALKTFRKIGDSYGIAMTLTNLQNVYRADGDWPRLRRVVNESRMLARRMGWLRMEAAALNGLAIVERHAKKYQEAEQACRDAIKIAKSIGYSGIEQTYTCTLGNVLKDQGRHDEARQCYQIVIDESQRRGFTRSLAAGKELMADLVEEDGDIKLGFKLGKEALKLFKELKDTYRIATVLDSQAGRFEKIGSFTSAGYFYVRAAEAWWKTRIVLEYSGSMISAIDCFLTAADQPKALLSWRKAWKRLSTPETAEISLKFFAKIASLKGGEDLLLAVPEITDQFHSAIVDGTPKTWIVIAVAKFAKLLKSLPAQAYGKNLQSLLAAYKARASQNLLLAMATLMEQSDNTFIDTPEFENFCTLLAQDLPSLHYSQKSHLPERWIVFLPARKAPAIEIEILSASAGIRALAAVCALLLWSERQLLSDTISKRKWRELGFSILIGSENEWNQNGMPAMEPLSVDFPVASSSSNVPPGKPQPHCMVVMRDDILQLSDRTQYPENNVSIGMMMVVYARALEHFTHFGFSDKAEQSARMRLISETFGVSFRSRDKE